MKVVATYGLSDAGITVYAPPGEPPGFGRKSFEVAIDNIDADLFGRAARVRCHDWSGLQAFAAVPGAAPFTPSCVSGTCVVKVIHCEYGINSNGVQR